MREKKGFVILTTLLILLLSIPIIWLLWKFVCKPVYRHFSGSKTSIEEPVDKTENKGTTLSEKFKKPIEYTKKLFTNEEEEKEADVKIDNCKSFLEKKDYENALIVCDEALEKTSDNGKIVNIHQLRGKIYQNTEKYDEARKEFITAEQATDNAQQKNQSKKMFMEADNLFKKSFLSREYNNRKLIIPVERAEETLPSHYIAAFLLDNIPDVKMPIGHPTANQLYIAHPYADKKYIPFDDYEMDFLGERVREFCEFVQALGATEVVIESIQSKSNEESSVSKKKKKGKTDLAKILPVSIGGGFDSNDENTRYLLDTALQGISISQKFTPNQKPFLPDNLVWYEHEPTWQQLYRQRMMGTLLEHREKIESRKSRMVQNTEIAKIKAELKSILKIADIDLDEFSEKKIVAKNDMELTIHVKFAPLTNTNNSALPLVVPMELN